MFGFGYESLVTANQGLLSDWLTGADNAQYFWSLGTAYCIARLVAVVNYNMSPLIVEHFESVPHGLWAGVVICGVSVLSALVLALITCRCPPDKPRPSGPPGSPSRRRTTAAEESNGNEGGEEIRASHAQHFNASFWLICLLTAIWFGSFFPFNNIASGYLQEKYDPDCLSNVSWSAPCRKEATTHANAVMSIPLGLSAVLMPLVVWIVDQIGLRPFWCVFASVGLAASFVLLRFPVLDFLPSAEQPIPAMGLLGMSYAVFTAAIWPSMYLEVDEDHRGSAFAYASAIKNAALSGVPMLIGYLRDRSSSLPPDAYDKVESYLLASSSFTVLLCLLLGCMSTRRRGSRGHLNAPTYATVQHPAYGSESSERSLSQGLMA